METTSEAQEAIDAARRPEPATALDTLSERVAAFRSLVTGSEEPVRGRIVAAAPSRAWSASARARRY